MEMNELKDVTLGKNVTIEEGTQIGRGTIIFDNSYIRKGAIIGENCKIARGVFVDNMAIIGNNVKIQNRNNISNGVVLKDGVFVGPNITFSNDKYPRSINVDGSLKNNQDWVLSKTYIEKGASIGAGAIIVCGVTVGEWAMIGAGAVVTKNLPSYALVVGNPARIMGWVSKSGYKMKLLSINQNDAIFYCEHENQEYKIPIDDYNKQL